MNRMAAMGIGVVLILAALIAGGVQLLHIFGSGNIYGSSANRWYFFGSVGIIGLVGIILVAWALMIKEKPKGVPVKANQ